MKKYLKMPLKFSSLPLSRQPSWTRPFNPTKFLSKLSLKNPQQAEFLQSVQEVIETLTPFIDQNPIYKQHKILERLVIPERIIIFRVPWIDDDGEYQINTGYRIQFNSALGPYKGGLR